MELKMQIQQRLQAFSGAVPGTIYSMLMAGALIAATAIEHGLSLLSGNEKHYRFLKMLTLEGFKP